jgi:hypothetical protein
MIKAKCVACTFIRKISGSLDNEEVVSFYKIRVIKL